MTDKAKRYVLSINLKRKGGKINPMTQDEWIEQNTFYCKIHDAKISAKTCKALSEKAKMQEKGEFKTRYGLRSAHNLFAENCIGCKKERIASMFQTNLNLRKVCKVCGQNLPVANYIKHNSSRDGLVATCNDCRTKKKTTPTPTPTPTQPTKTNTIVLDFSDRPDLLQQINEIATGEFRTTENQIKSWLLSHVRVHNMEANPCR